jgi:flagellar motor switch protein FliM
MNRKQNNQKRQNKARKDVDVPTHGLSQDEIDLILTAINAGDYDSPENFKHDLFSRKIRLYDFKRPDKFSKEQIRTLSMMHETFARLSTTSLSAQLHSVVHVHVASVDQLTYEEFIRSIPTPTTLSIINLDPLGVNAILEIDPAITFSIIDRLCGGTGEGNKSQHELTDIEQSIMEGIVIRMLGNMREAWTQVIDLRPRLGQIYTNPQFAQIIPPSDMTVLITMEAEIGEVGGMINFCIPYIALEPILNKLNTAYWFGARMLSTPDCKLVGREDVPIQMTAEILKRNFSIEEVTGWDRETVILPLRPLTPHRCFLKFGNNRVWLCEILPEDKRYAKFIKIIDYVDKPLGTEGKEMEVPKRNPLVAESLSNAGITITVELGSTAKTVKEILSMGEGTIIELDKLAGEPVDVKANGVLIAKGEVVVIDENFGVRITEIVVPLGLLGEPVEVEDPQNS